MARLEELTRGASLRGILPDSLVTIVGVNWYGSEAIELTYKDASGRPGIRLLYRDDEAALELVSAGRPWSFDGDGRMFRLVSEAHRIRLAHLFDPVLAVHTSVVEPLPHQITAVYETRMVKERLLKFDGTPLFPERIAYTVPYKLSDAEAQLYREVTNYVRDEFNRAEALQNDKRAGTVGFALTVLPRRLAFSPEAIFQSLHRRRERLEKRLRELQLLQRGAVAAAIGGTRFLDAEDVEDLEDAPESEVEAVEEEILDQATAARTIDELKLESATLGRLESLALAVRRSGEDRKWRELASLLGEIFTPVAIANRLAEERATYSVGPIAPPTPSPHQKLVVFTEHRDTLNYLMQRITTLLGRTEAVVTIHAGMGREERLKAQESFRHDPDVQVLIATDAAGEGINLQRAHLMVNYDLPWNPNRLEQQARRLHPGDGRVPVGRYTPGPLPAPAVPV